MHVAVNDRDVHKANPFRCSTWMGKHIQADRSWRSALSCFQLPYNALAG